MPLKLRLPPPPSPEARAGAAVWATLLDLAVLCLAVFWTVDAFAPPQDLAWKPLRLNDPVGLATGLKFARVAEDPAACRAVLREGGVSFTDQPERTQGFCTTRNTMRLGDGATRLSPAGPTMTCANTLAYAFWERHVVQPAARELLNTRVARVEHYGTYACRNIYGRAEGRPSEHASANALDVSGFRLSRGGQVTVVGDFRDEGPKGQFLRRVRDGACDWFRATLSPDYNAAHRDHLHLDFGRYRVCR